jgi:hypothetical protein
MIGRGPGPTGSRSRSPGRRRRSTAAPSIAAASAANSGTRPTGNDSVWLRPGGVAMTGVETGSTVGTAFREGSTTSRRLIHREPRAIGGEPEVRGTVRSSAGPLATAAATADRESVPGAVSERVGGPAGCGRAADRVCVDSTDDALARASPSRFGSSVALEGSAAGGAAVGVAAGTGGGSIGAAVGADAAGSGTVPGAGTVTGATGCPGGRGCAPDGAPTGAGGAGAGSPLGAADGGEEAGRAGKSVSGSTYPCSSALTRTPR